MMLKIEFTMKKPKTPNKPKKLQIKLTEKNINLMFPFQ